jgi:hypothetical protein
MVAAERGKHLPRETRPRPGQARMGGNAKKVDWQIKELLFLAPLLGTSLAISYEVGRFLPFGGFRFFSLSEHLLAAVAALPVAVFLSLYFLAAFAGIKHIGIIEGRRGITRFVVGCTLGIVPAVLLIGAMTDGTYSFAIVAVAATMVLIFAVVLLSRYDLTNPAAMAVVYAFSLVIAILLAQEVSRTTVIAAKNHTNGVLSEIVTNSGTTKAYVVMSGERGLLLYNPDTDRVSYQKMDEVQKIEWSAR